MKYEIRKLEGVYVVFKKDTIVAAFLTKKDALEAIEKHKKHC